MIRTQGRPVRDAESSQSPAANQRAVKQNPRPMIVLGLESSCDETAAAIYDGALGLRAARHRDLALEECRRDPARRPHCGAAPPRGAAR